VEDPVQPTQQASESSEADVTQEASDERIVPEGEGETEVADIEAAQEMVDSEASEEEEVETPEATEEREAAQTEEEATDGQEEVQPEEEQVLDPFDELAHIDYDNEQYEGKEVYPEMFAPAEATNYEEFDSFFNPSYAEMQDALQNPAEPQTLDPIENAEPTEQAMPSLDTLEASNQAATWISEAQEDEEPSIRIDPSLLRF
jgi:hypothetical protein